MNNEESARQVVTQDGERSPRRLRIVIADDHPTTRMGIKTYLRLEDDMEVVGEAEDGNEAVRLVRELEPDIVLMDLRMPGLDGVQATRQIARNTPGTKVVAFSSYETEVHVSQALQSGALGYVFKEELTEKVSAAIRMVANGESYLSPRATRYAVDRLGPHANRLLSQNELSVLRLIAKERTNPEIATELNMSVSVVKRTIQSTFSKLKVSKRTTAVARGVELGLIGVEAED